MSDLKKYVRKTKELPGFKGIDFKWSDGDGDEFPRLSVKVREELVSFGRAYQLEVDSSGVVGGGKHLNPYQVNQLVAKQGDDVVFFDGRNSFEAKVALSVMARGAELMDIGRDRYIPLIPEKLLILMKIHRCWVAVISVKMQQKISIIVSIPPAMNSFYSVESVRKIRSIELAPTFIDPLSRINLFTDFKYKMAP